MKQERLHALDAVRAFAMLAGVVLHATLSFIPASGFPIPDRSPSVFLAIVFFVVHMFRMATFFLIAGFFGHLLFHREGPLAFIQNRTVRIVIPFVACWMLISPLSVSAYIWAVKDPTAKAEWLREFPTLSLEHFPLTHLWFLYFLILTYVFTLVARAGIDLIDRNQALRVRMDRWMRGLVHGPFLLVLLAALSAISLLFFSPGWNGWYGVPTPERTLIPNRPAMVVFGSAFAIGWFIHRQVALLEVWERQWLHYLMLAVAMTTASLSLAGLTPGPGGSPRTAGLFIYAVCYSVGLWAWTFAIVGTALRFFRAYSPVRRYLVDASYWTYLVHYPLVLFLQAVLMDTPWHWSVKFPLIVAVSYAAVFATYHVLVRYTALGAILNGRQPGTNKPLRAVLEAPSSAH